MHTLFISWLSECKYFSEGLREDLKYGGATRWKELEFCLVKSQVDCVLKRKS